MYHRLHPRHKCHGFTLFNIKMINSKEIIKQVQKIDINTKRLVDGLISGNYHSIFKGQGIEFSEIRDYKAGDDIRSIDWKVTARFNRPFVKEFIEERDLNIYFAFDFSASNLFGNIVDKKRKSLDIVASLMFSALRNNDNVGLFIFTDGVEKYYSARKGKKHILKLISNLISYTPNNKITNLNKSLFNIGNIIKKRSIIFIISDFYSDNFSKPLSILKNKHDVIAIKVNDSRENSIPDVGNIQLEDEETGEQIFVNTSDEKFRKNYMQIMKAENAKQKKLFKKYKIDSIQLLTDQEYKVSLKKFFNLRKKKVNV